LSRASIEAKRERRLADETYNRRHPESNEQEKRQ
jgi:hypothetical protein